MALLIALLSFMLIGLTSPSIEYVYDVSVLSYFKIYAQSYLNDAYYFRVPFNNLDDMYFQIETDNVVGLNYVTDFKVDICGYDHKPTTQECINGHSNCRVGLVPTITYEAEYYDQSLLSAYYKYTFATLDNVEYLVFCVTCMNPKRFLKTIYIYSNKAALDLDKIALAVLANILMIFLICICLSVIVWFILRFCRCFGHTRIS